MPPCSLSCGTVVRVTAKTIGKSDFLLTRFSSLFWCQNGKPSGAEHFRSAPPEGVADPRQVLSAASWPVVSRAHTHLVLQQHSLGLFVTSFLFQAQEEVENFQCQVDWD
jgi:hypothetical protein